MRTFWNGGSNIWKNGYHQELQTAKQLLIGEDGYAGLARSFSFADYSNAAAIICLHDPMRNAATHFNGAFREAGIPILAGHISPEFLSGLKLDGITNKKVLVYANDAKEEGFVAAF